MRRNVDSGAGTIDVLAGIEDDAYVRYRAANHAMLNKIEGIQNFEDFNAAMQNPLMANRITHSFRRHNFSEIEYRLACIKDSIHEPVPEVHTDWTRATRTALFGGCMCIYANTIFPGPTGFVFYTSLGIAAFVGTIEAAKYGVSKLRN